MKTPSREIESLINQGFRCSGEQHQRGLASRTGLLRSVDSGAIFWQGLLLWGDDGTWAGGSIHQTQLHLLASMKTMPMTLTPMGPPLSQPLT